MFETDVTSHVAENDDIKEIEKNGNKHKVPIKPN